MLLIDYTLYLDPHCTDKFWTFKNDFARFYVKMTIGGGSVSVGEQLCEKKLVGPAKNLQKLRWRGGKIPVIDTAHHNVNHKCVKCCASFEHQIQFNHL